jgi:hypothetical protein
VITVSTSLDVLAVGQGISPITEKYVTVRLNHDDAFAIATILMNDQSNISDDWKQSIRLLAQELVEAGNRCQ